MMRAILEIVAPMLIGVIAFAQSSLAGEPSHAGVLGDWQTSAGSVIKIEHCGKHGAGESSKGGGHVDDVCMRVIRVAPKAKATSDIRNPNPALRSRPLCGLEIGIGFRLESANHADGGEMYNPWTGKSYHGKISAQQRKLHLRGYIGIPLFGRSVTWTRPRDAITPCNSGKQ